MGTILRFTPQHEQGKKRSQPRNARASERRYQFPRPDMVSEISCCRGTHRGRAKRAPGGDRAGA